MFIKHGDGKILAVVPEEELTEEQKKTAKDLSKRFIKTDESDSSTESESEK